MINFIELDGWNVLKLELNVLHHSLEGFFGFVLVTGEEQEDFLLVEVVCVVLYFLLCAVNVELFQLFLFVLVMLDLTIEIESGTLFVKGGLLLLV